MSDPRNVAHDKKVLQEKKHHGVDAAEGAVHKVVQPGKKPEMQHPHEHGTHEDPATERQLAAEEKIAEIEATVEAHEERTDAHKHSEKDEG